MKNFAKTISLVCLLASAQDCVQVFGEDAPGEQNVSPYAVVLISSDLSDAKIAMRTYDVNDDAEIDSSELQRLPWKDQVQEFDLNRDGKITHLEIAVRSGVLRKAAGIIEIDTIIAGRRIKKFDKNGNGRLDPSEMENLWPEDPDEFDSNSDGTIMRQELVQHLAFERQLRGHLGIVGVDQGGAIKFVSGGDKNGSRRLESDEWENVPLPLAPEEFDQNSDGSLSVMDVATMLAKHRTQLGLTHSDQNRVHSMFALFDTNKDWEIGASELSGGRALGETGVELRQCDRNNDQTVTLLEVESKLAKDRAEIGYSDEDYSGAKLQMLRLDQDRSGKLSREELKASSNLRLGVSRLDQWDKDADGSLSVDEIARNYHLVAPSQNTN